MNEGNQFVIPIPSEGETLTEYLQRFTDEEILQINNDPSLLRIFVSVLQEYFTTEGDLENLWTIIQQVNDFDRLQNFIQRLEPTRLRLLESLQRNSEEIQRIYTLCNAGRLVGSAIDIVGTVNGLLMRESSPGYSTLAFRTATAFGLFGLASTLSEMHILKNTLDDLMKLIKEDQELLAPIQIWYRKTNELEKAMGDIFPFHDTNKIVKEFADLRNSQITPDFLLTTLLRSIGEQDISRWRDSRLIGNLISFTLHPESRNCLEWIVMRHYPVILDFAKIIQQLPSPLRLFLQQSIPALALLDQDIQSLPVWGRIGLNVVSIVNSIRSLRRSLSPVASGIRHLEIHFRSEMAVLQRISDFIQGRKDQ